MVLIVRYIGSFHLNCVEDIFLATWKSNLHVNWSRLNEVYDSSRRLFLFQMCVEGSSEESV